MSDAAAVRAAIAADLRRVQERLRNAPIARVAAVGDQVRDALTQLADGALGIHERAADTAPDWHEVPILIDSALGDQIAVLGAELTNAASGVGDNESVWSRTGRIALADVLADLALTLKGLRFAL